MWHLGSLRVWGGGDQSLSEGAAQIYARAYTELILEGGKMKKKFRGAKSHFLPKNTNFFQKLIFLSEKSVRREGGQLPPSAPLGYALGYMGTPSTRKPPHRVTLESELPGENCHSGSRHVFVFFGSVDLGVIVHSSEGYLVVSWVPTLVWSYPPWRYK